jgi:hypothetical protein
VIGPLHQIVPGAKVILELEVLDLAADGRSQAAGGIGGQWRGKQEQNQKTSRYIHDVQPRNESGVVGLRLQSATTGAAKGGEKLNP